MKIRINSSLQIEVDQNKYDCSCEPAHCHVTRDGTRVALVWLNPVRIEYGHSLDYKEAIQVYDAVEENLYVLMEEYKRNRERGTD